MKISVTAVLVAIGLSCAACATGPNGDITIFGKDTGVTSAQSQATIQSVLDTGCPLVGVLAANPPKMSAFQKQALTQLVNACPPNPAPTNAVVAATDLLAAYEALAPLVHGAK